jgi:hypothetical protein
MFRIVWNLNNVLRTEMYANLDLYYIYAKLSQHQSL